METGLQKEGLMIRVIMKNQKDSEGMYNFWIVKNAE